MASSRYLAKNVVDALFDDDFGLSDEDNSADNEDNCIHGYAPDWPHLLHPRCFCLTWYFAWMD